MFVTVQIYPTNMVLWDIHRIFEISHKVDVGRLKTFKKWTIQEQCIAINQVSEAVSRRCSVKQDFLKVLQSSQENDCAIACSLLKKLILDFIEKEALARLFSYDFCEILQDTFFDRTPSVAAS